MQTVFHPLISKVLKICTLELLDFATDKYAWNIYFLTEDPAFKAETIKDASSFKDPFQDTGNGFLSLVDNTKAHWIEIELPGGGRPIIEVYVHRIMGQPELDWMFKNYEVRIGNTKTIAGSDQRLTHNPICNSGPDGEILESYYIYKCATPMTGRYITIQTDPDLNDPLAISEVNFRSLNQWGKTKQH